MRRGGRLIVAEALSVREEALCVDLLLEVPCPLLSLFKKDPPPPPRGDPHPHVKIHPSKRISSGRPKGDLHWLNVEPRRCKSLINMT